MSRIQVLQRTSEKGGASFIGKAPMAETLDRRALVADNTDLVDVLIRTRTIGVTPILTLARNRDIDILDIKQAGYVGLCEAAERYNPEGALFQTFAESYILKEIRELLSSMGHRVHVPRNARYLISCSKRAVEFLEEEGMQPGKDALETLKEEDPTTYKMVVRIGGDQAKLGKLKEQIAKREDAINKAVRAVNSDDASKYDRRLTRSSEERIAISQIIAKMPEFEGRLLAEKYLGKPRTDEELARDLEGFIIQMNGKPLSKNALWARMKIALEMARDIAKGEKPKETKFRWSAEKRSALTSLMEAKPRVKIPELTRLLEERFPGQGLTKTAVRKIVKEIRADSSQEF